ncbi:MAG TPA: metallophosphoesterase family protein [Pirellulales bacterium]
MRTLAIGDVHGCFTALAALEKFVPFRPDDLLVTLGDYVDRGPDSFAVIDWLIAYGKRAKLVALRGNHEIMMLDARTGRYALDRFLYCGGTATLDSYSPLGDEGRLADVPDEHWRFIEASRSWYETETHFFVHANAYPDYPLEIQPELMLFWESFNSPSPHESGKVMVCGHTPQRSGVPLNIGHAVCIDTWACGDGWLTCLDVASGRFWQADQRGATRRGWLDEL